MFDFIGKFSANGSRVEIRNYQHVLHQGVGGHMEFFMHAVQTVQTSGAEDNLHQNCQI